MKRNLESVSLGLVLFIALALSACSGGGDGLSRPTTPAGVSATAGDAEVTLGWNAATGGDSYTIYWGISPGVSTANASISSIASAYTHTGLTNGTTYYYAVTAVNTAGESALSSEVSAAPQAALPFVPSGVSVTVGNKQLTISWNPVTGATSYNIYWATSTGVTKATGTKIAGVTSPYVHTGLANGTMYYYVVTAVSALGESVESSQVAGAPQLPVPGLPSATRGIHAVTIQWSPIAGSTSYNIYWSKTALVTKSTGTKITNATSPYKHAGLLAGTYYYVVTAVGPEGESGPSQEVSAPVNLVAFLTSATGNGILGSWLTANPDTGLAAGDKICQVAANTAGLYGTFRAWLSDDTSDAYCRVHNLLNVKKSANCGQSSLPVSAGPWIRTDGTPFAGTINYMVGPTYRIYNPARFDENGVEVTTSTDYRTATNTVGAVASSGSYTSTCSNWTSNSSQYVESGFSDCSAYGITGGCVTMTCGASSPILCFQTDAGPALPSITPVGKKAFLTSTTGNGNLSSWTGSGGNSGLAAGDAVCQSLANAKGWTGTFKAWLSNSTTNAADRFTSDGPWVRPDGIKVAVNKADLINGTLFTAINLTNTGSYFGNSGAWTGSRDDGTKDNGTCNNWSDNTATFDGTVGSVYKAAAGWSHTWSTTAIPPSPVYCNSTNMHLYCLED